MSPPATLNPNEKLSTFMQDTPRGPILAAIPFVNQKKVVGLWDSLNTMDEGSRVSNDQVLTWLMRAFFKSVFAWQLEEETTGAKVPPERFRKGCLWN